MNFMEKPKVSDELIGIAETLILGGIVWSSADDADAGKSGGYTTQELEAAIGSVELHTLASAWVAAAIEANWDEWHMLNKTPNEIWQCLMYTMCHGCVSIGRKLRNNVAVDKIIAEWKR